MKRAAAIVLLAFFALGKAEAAKPKSTLRVHLQANENDSAVFSTKMRSPTTGKNIVMEKVPRISEQDVVAFYPYQAADSSYGVLFKLSEHGKLALDTVSVERRGAFLYIFVNGRPAAEQQIDRRVSDGKIFVPSGLTQNDLALMRQQWRLMGQRKKEPRR